MFKINFSKLLSNWLIPGLVLTAFYLASHLIGLSKLPVFADEAIYIRWSQLMVDDAKRYAFFPLNDGKTPLYVWLGWPLQLSSLDPLIAGRIISVVAGLGLIWIMWLLAAEYGLNRKWQWAAALATAIWPFWFFHQRMALMDALLVLWLSLAWLSLLKSLKAFHWGWTILAGFGFGLAMLTKLPAILFAPSLAVAFVHSYYLNQAKPSLIDFIQKFKSKIPHLMLMGTIGLGLFVALKFHPAFGQLFSRGGDFLYKLPELTSWRIFHNLWVNGLSFGETFGRYLTWGGLALIPIGLFSRRRRRSILILLLMSLAFFLPIQIMGKVIYSRYLLPAALPLSLAIILAAEGLVNKINTTKKLKVKAVFTAVVAVLIAQSLTQSCRFMLYSWLNPNNLDLTVADQVQYLTEWSAGNGVKEVTDAALMVSQKQSLLVLTEGFFGTLPDGVLLYLHQQKLKNLFVEGIGQPISGIPDKYTEKINYYDQIWLVVNSHRMKLDLPPDMLLGQYCRLPKAPCLQVWNIKPYLVTKSAL